jgi:hypothetical protein
VRSVLGERHVEVGYEQIGGTTSRPSEHITRVIHDETVAVKDEVVLAANQI